MTKVCKDCPEKGPQPYDNFGKRGDGSGSPLARCRTCHRIWRRRFRLEGLTRIKPQMATEVPSGPFCAWLVEYVARFDTFDQACQSLRRKERVVYRWVHRPGPYVEETTVDEFFCAAGEPHLLYLLYPELYENDLGMAA